MITVRTTDEAIETVRAGARELVAKGRKVDLEAVTQYLSRAAQAGATCAQISENAVAVGTWDSATDPLERVLDRGERSEDGPDFDALVRAIAVGYILARDGMGDSPDDYIRGLSYNWDSLLDTAWGEALVRAEIGARPDFDEYRAEDWGVVEGAAYRAAMDLIQTARDEALYLDFPNR